MAANPANAAFWAHAKVFVDFTGEAAEPTDVSTAWATGWQEIGLLDGENGFVESREDETEDHYAWGGILIRTTRAQHRRTIQFTALERNPATFQLLNPGSTQDDPDTAGVTKSTVKVPENVEVAIGFETRDGNKVKRRYCARASVDEIGEVTETEQAPVTYEITMVLYPDVDGVLYTELEGDPADAV